MKTKRLVKCIGFLPPILLLLVIGWSYYAYVISFNALFVASRSVFAAVVFITFYHLFGILLLISMYRVIFTHPGRAPPNWKVSKETVREWELTPDEIDAKVSQYVGKEVKILLKKPGGKLRYCDECEVLKPDRTHHCGTCEECITKFDHHCPWINNCVGWRNYKFFLLFLFYGFLFSVFIFITTIPFLASEISQDGFSGIDFQWLILVVLGAAFALALLMFLTMHIRLLLLNMTTLEDMDKSKVPIYYELGYWPFNVSGKVNVSEVLGEKMWHWFLPISSITHDGTSFPVRSSVDVEEGQHLIGEN